MPCPETAAIRLPAEWEPHEATILAWPTNRMDWPGKFQAIPWVFAEIVRRVAEGERVDLIVPSSSAEPRIRRLLTRAHVDLSRINFLALEMDRGWMRDCSPAFVLTEDANPRVNAVQFAFNGWAKYDNWRKDARATEYLATHLADAATEATWNGRHVVLEGGAIDTNGARTLLTTEECLLHREVQVRNPGFTREDYEGAFRALLGIEKVIWLGNGIAGDDTHGHVDDLCRFVNANTVVLCRETNPADANYAPLEENWERLQGATTADQRRIDVVALPMPGPLYFDGVRLPASYANFYIANGYVLVPTFNDPNDRIALGILSEMFPDRAVCGIHAVDLVWGFGTLHCLTHEVPAAGTSLHSRGTRSRVN